MTYFFIQESEDTVPYTQSVKWFSGYSDVRDHEIYQE